MDPLDPVDPPAPGEPPVDPEEWTDEQWIAWLRATDADAEADAQARAGEDDAPVTHVGRIAHSSGGQVLGQAMLGMANVLFGRKDDEVVIVAEGDSEPDGDEPFTVHLDRDHPERSSVVFKPDQR